MGLSGNIVAESNIRKFNEAHPEFALDIGKTGNDDDDTLWKDTRHAEKLFTEMQINRNRMIPEDRWMPDVRSIWKAWKNWMEDNKFIDFTSMLERVLEYKMCPDIDILFVDEAQDLTPLQLAIVEKWSEKVNQTVFAGDSDQGIYKFAGTVPEAFINLKHDWSHHLDQSYRVPAAVREYSRKIITLCKNRDDTDYKPVSKDMAEYKGKGQVYRCFSPDMSLPGTHMILCRCKYQLKRWMAVLEQNNILWHNPYRPEDLSWNPTLTSSWTAAQTYCDLMAGREVSPERFVKMVEKLKPGFYKRGSKKQIKERMWTKSDKIDIFNLIMMGFNADFVERTHAVADVLSLTDRVARLLPRSSNLDEMAAFFSGKKTCIVGTVHSVKGGEAEHVWLDTSLPPIIWREIRQYPEAFYDECRVAYVAATRAKQTLGLVSTNNWSPVLSQVI
uniref:Putative helicase n=1 Tax=viral metagenome TaxID=1070528 RepID=A0A6M3IZJ1_9ZZZZ